METKSTPLHPAPALLALSAGLAAWNWDVTPGRAGAWAMLLALVAGLTVVYFSAPRRAAGDPIRSAVGFAGLMLALTLGAKLANALGASTYDGLSQRATMVVLGAFLVATGNALPKTLTPLSVLRCDPARAQAFHRFSGYTWVLSGITLSAAWIALPIASADTATLVLMPACILAILVQVVRLRWSRPSVHPTGSGWSS